MSSYSRDLDHDVLECLDNEVSEFSQKGDVILCGDFNARVANENDFIVNDSNSFVPLHNNYSIDNSLMHRNSHDYKVDTRGKSLLDFCISHQLRVKNT